MRTTYKIPIKPHLKKFIIKRFIKKSKILFVDEESKDDKVGSSFDKMIQLCLRDNRKRSEFNDQYRDKLTDELVVELGTKLNELSPRIGKLMRINIYADSLFKEALLIWIEAQGEDGISPHAACKSFIKFYDIDESEYALTTAYQYYQRSKTK